MKMGEADGQSSVRCANPETYLLQKIHANSARAASSLFFESKTRLAVVPAILDGFRLYREVGTASCYGMRRIECEGGAEEALQSQSPLLTLSLWSSL